MPYGVDDFKIRTGLPQLPDDNIPKELYGAFLYVYQAIQNLQRGTSEYAGIDAPASDIRGELTYQDTLMMGNLTRMYPYAAVAIARGQMVNLYNDAGTLKARLAVATSGSTMAHGIANEAAAIGQQFEMQWLRATVDSVGGMTLGTLYYLSTVAGSIQSARPAVAGQIVQPIGLALADATLAMDISLYFQQL